MESNAVNFRNCHLIVGGPGLLLFVLQGQYMARVLGVEHLADAPLHCCYCTSSIAGSEAGRNVCDIEQAAALSVLWPAGGTYTIERLSTTLPVAILRLSLHLD